MELYHVKLINREHGVTVSQYKSAQSHDEALALVIQEQNDFLGVDYDPELDTQTLVVVTKVEVQPVKTYKVVFEYEIELTASSSEEAEEFAWELFCQETESSNFNLTIKEKK